MSALTQRELASLAHLLSGEELACKKASVYANTLTDAALAAAMDEVSRAHAAHFSALLALVGGKE